MTKATVQQQVSHRTVANAEVDVRQPHPDTTASRPQACANAHADKSIGNPPTEHLENELGVAAYLLAKGFRLLGLLEVAPGRYSFRFHDDGSTAQAAFDYFQGATIAAKDMFSAERSLKTLLYSRPNPGLGNRNFNPNRKGDHRHGLPTR